MIREEIKKIKKKIKIKINSHSEKPIKFNFSKLHITNYIEISQNVREDISFKGILVERIPTSAQRKRAAQNNPKYSFLLRNDNVFTVH